ncbi:regulator of Vps4 activity in the MVB pathway-domain-containing protein [Flammula alnicola]|nr:regulator of Vps4 activity in the MVB pathway-domain-containing protein [Flammula alnicola]
MIKWEPAAAKSQLRLASQRLGQVQATIDSQANITRTDIATLIQRGNVPLAREKAEKLIMDEAYGDLLEELEMQLGILQEHFQELERGIFPSPVMIEATSTIIYAAPHVHSKDLDVTRSFLVQRLGPDFARSAIGNKDQQVSERVFKAISIPVPSAFQLDSYMHDIAQSYGVSWTPVPPRQSIVNVLSEFLDPEASPQVDLSRLRKLCVQGIPDEPAWLRPRIWKLLLGILPEVKASWKPEIIKQRDAYYDLVRRLLEPFSRPSVGPSPSDETLLEAYKQLSGLPRSVFALIEDEPETFAQCPLNEGVPEDVRIPYARILETRLKVLQNEDKEGSHLAPTPEIRLEPEEDVTPGISLTSSDSTRSESQTTSTTLLPSRKRIFGTAHPQHCSSLLRLAYLHNTINPGSMSYHTPSVLVPLYSVLLQEVDAEDLAHVEADTFWLLEAVVAEFAGLEDDEGHLWMKKFSDRLSWADAEFQTHLEDSGLDPSLPHYSYRWLMPILTHTLPLSSLFLVWDVLFCQPPRERSLNPKLDYLLDICTSMLLRAKNHLYRLGKVGQSTRSLWTDEVEYVPQLPLVPGQSQDSFMEALSFLQLYDPKRVGGIERILQTAYELAQRREQESVNAQQPTLSLGARFKVNVWRGLTHQRQTSATEPPAESNKRLSSDYTDSDETETSATTQSTLASQISNTFWRGITNQTAMEDEVPSIPPSPEPPAPVDIAANIQSKQTQSPPNSQASSNIWSYAEKLKGSDTVATLSKVGTNWRARGFLGSWGMNTQNAPTEHSAPNATETEHLSQLESISSRTRGSIPFFDSPGIFSPPLPPKKPSAQTPQALSPLHSAGFLEKTKTLISMRSPPLVPMKSVPKPLVLNSGSPIISGRRKSSGHPRSASATSAMLTPDTDEWADVMRAKRNHFHRDSQSSVSSLSPSDAFARIPKSSRSEYDSDNSSSRIVALNRRSISPMAPNFHVAHARLSRPSSRNSSASSDIHSPPLIAKSPLQESTSLDSQRTVSPEAKESESSDATSSELPAPSRKSSWKRSGVADSENSLPTTPIGVTARSPRVRAKRYPRPANLQIQDTQRSRISAEQKTSSPSKLTVEWPADDQESITTPKASSFDSDDHVSVSPGLSRSSRRPRKLSSNDQERPRKSSMDTITNEERPRKVSTGHRARKVSTESREIPRSRRESAAEEGDDEGYDELLSAYESEEGPSLR